LDALSQHAPHRKAFVLLSILPCPYAGRAPPFPVDEKEEKILSKCPFFPPQDFFFPAHNPEYPPKILPAYAGPGDFDGPRRFHLRVKWGT